MMSPTGMSTMIFVSVAQVHATELAEVCYQYCLVELSLFGSAVPGEMGPNSDIDVLVELDPSTGIGIVEFFSLVDCLERLVGRKVELVTKRGLKPWVRPRVSREARVIYAA